MHKSKSHILMNVMRDAGGGSGLAVKSLRLANGSTLLQAEGSLIGAMIGLVPFQHGKLMRAFVKI